MLLFVAIVHDIVDGGHQHHWARYTINHLLKPNHNNDNG